MNKSVFIGALVLMLGYVGFVKLRNSDEDQVIASLEKVLKIGSIAKPLTPVQAFLKAKSYSAYFSPQIDIRFEEEDVQFHQTGRKLLLEKIALAKIKLQKFDVSHYRSIVTISGDIATVETDIKGHGEIIGYQKYFSEIRRFKIEFMKIDSDWIITNIENSEKKDPDESGP